MKNTIMLVGAGGTGSWLFPVLCMEARTLSQVGINHWIVKDRDVVEEGNLSRQNHSPTSVGKPKVDTLVAACRHLLPSDMVVTQLFDWFEEHSLVPENTVVIAAVDNHVARNNILEAVDRSPGSSALILGNEIESATADWYEPEWKDTPLDIRVRHPEITTDKSDDPRRPHCDSAESGGQTAAANFMSAALGMRLLKTWLLKVPQLNEQARNAAPVKLVSFPFGVQAFNMEDFGDGQENH